MGKGSLRRPTDEEAVARNWPFPPRPRRQPVTTQDTLEDVPPVPLEEALAEASGGEKVLDLMDALKRSLEGR